MASKEGEKGYKELKKVYGLGREYELTSKQQVFCDEYLANGNNALQACIKAGYVDVKVGHKLLKTTKIQRYIKAMSNLHAAAKSLTLLEKQKDRLDYVIERCLEQENWNSALKAIETLNKMEGFNAPDVKVNLKSDVELSFGGWSPAITTTVHNQLPEYSEDELDEDEDENFIDVEPDEVEETGEDEELDEDE